MADVILGIDFGSKRIGVAVGDSEVRLAHVLTTIVADDPIAHLRELAEKEGATVAVVGLPRGLDGQETVQTGLAREFADVVTAELGLTVHLQDEAGTSGVAEDRLKASGKQYSATDIDAEAAVIILQDYLDSL